MYCKTCGHQSPEGTTNCPKCGAVLTVDFDIAPAATPAKPVAAAPGEWPDDREFDEELWTHAIGPNSTDYYLAKFRQIHEGGGTVSWNWPAFFITFLWMPHRKMWGWLAVYLFAPVLVSVPYQFVSRRTVTDLASGVAINVVTALVLLLLELVLAFVVVPLAANNLYYRHLKDLIVRTRVKYRSRDRVLKELDTAGGTGKGALIVAVLAVVALVIAGIVSAIITFNLLQKATKTKVAMNAAAAVVRQIAYDVQSHRGLPISIVQYTGNAGIRQNISDVQLDQTTGVVTFELSFGGRSHDGKLIFEPDTTDWTHYVTWHCRADERARKYAPIECQPEVLEQMRELQQQFQR
jgi:hypothetical protein